MFQKIKNLLLVNTSTKQTIVKNTFWLTAGTVLSRGIRALIVIYAARILGVEGYGVFSYAMSLAAFFSIFSDLGLSSLLTREVSKDSEKKSAYVSTIFYVKGAILFLTVILTLIFAPFLIKISAVQPLIPIAILLVLFDNIRVFGFSFARARNKMEIEGALSVVTDVLITIFGITLLFTNPSPKGLASMYLLGSAIGAFLIFLVLRKYIKRIYAGFDRKLIKPILTASSPFIIMGIFGAFMINIDMVILGIFRSASELGLYSAAQRPVQLLYILPTLIASSIFPILSKFAHDKEDTKSKTILETSITSVILIALPLTMGGVILAKQIIPLVFGANYAGSILAFQLLITTTLLVFPGTIIGNTIFSYNLQKKLILTTGAGATVNVILDLLLIPMFGINGSAVATIVSQFTANGLNWRLLKLHVPFSVFNKLGKTILASIIMGVTTWVFMLFGMHVILNIALSAIIYMLLLFIFKEQIFMQIKKMVHSAISTENTNPPIHT